jgi:hypothetical protein
MTREQEELEALKKMVETDGWRIFHREHSERVAKLRLQSWDSIKTLEELNYMKGFLAALEGVVGYDKILDAAEASLNDPDGQNTF